MHNKKSKLSKPSIKYLPESSPATMGCSGPPEYDPVCAVCGGYVDNNECICPECPVCEEIGHPTCYEKHGLIKTPAQIAQRAAIEQAWEEEAKAEAKYFAQHPDSN